jgi:catechol 2,3-dioxygenase-like lactoylglutathione lyase family enzyme
LSACLLQQSHALRDDNLLFANQPDAFARFRLQADLFWGYPQYFGDPPANGGPLGTQLGPFGEHNAVHVYDRVPGVTDLPTGNLEHFGGISIAVRFVRAGKQFADVT